jgi:energy-converting hydrogenase B subunit D
MNVLLGTALVLVAAAGTVVVVLRDPLRQALAVSMFGILLGILFFAVQAPDVALSEIVVGAVALPLMILLALAKIRGGAQ